MTIGTTFALLLLATTASAHHANLVRSEPARGAQLGQAPREVRAWFSLPLIVPGSGLAVADASGRRVDTAPARLDPADPRLLAVPLAPLGQESYTVTWRVMAEFDLDYNEGSFGFAVVADPIVVLLDRLRSGGLLAVGLGLLALGVVRASIESTVIPSTARNVERRGDHGRNDASP